MKKIYTIIIGLALSITAWSQPNYSLNTYSAKTGKKASYYNNEANRFIKRGYYNEAVLNAAHALKLSNKKRGLSEAQERLNDSYNLAIQENLERINILKEKNTSFNGDQTVTEMAEIVRIYTTMHNYNTILSSISPKAFKAVKKRDTGLHLDINNYKDDLKAAKEAFEKSKYDAANMHYNRGIELSKLTDRQSNKEAARLFKWSTMYVKNFKDSNTRYETSKNLGTTRMGIIAFENSYQARSYGDLGSMTTENLIGKLLQRTQLEFFQLISRDQLNLILQEQQLNLSGMMDETSTVEVGQLKGVHVLLVGKINTATTDRQSLQPQTFTLEEKVSNGKEKYKDKDGIEKERTSYKTVHADVDIFTKTAQASSSGSFKIVDVETGTIIKAGTINGDYKWEHQWARYKGDERALSSEYKTLVNKTDTPFPLNSILIQNAIENLTINLSNEIKAYANQVGH